MKKIRNRFTGAEISSPYLVKERNNNTKAEWFIDHKSNTGVFYLRDGWEEVEDITLNYISQKLDRLKEEVQRLNPYHSNNCNPG